jgi:hypothetical protein
MEQKKSSSLRTTDKSNRLIPRDLAESLGKLPPQALDLEESILGALLLERSAYDKLKDFFKPKYLYSEAHKEIYSSIQLLVSKGAPIDMRTVANQLRIDGKIELVGGAYYIAELTSKVSSAANIEYHARVVMEMHIKRELINIASKIHQDAYEESTDALELLDQITEKAEATKDDVLRTSGPNKIKAQWVEKLLTSLPDEPPPMIFIDGCPVAWPGGHSLLVGKKKSRKTLFVVWLVAQYLKAKNTTGQEVLVFDTEQAKRHVFRIREKIQKMSGKTVNVFYLRGMSPEERRDFIRETILHWPTAPQLIIIDGIRDLMKDINSTDESTDLLVWLEKLTITQREGQQYMPHIVNILHLNKGDSNPRGHIGTELLNKADCTIELELDMKAGCTDVKCESSREKPFNNFSFTHSADDMPVIVTNASHSAITHDDRKNRLHIIFEDGMLSRTQLVNGIKEHFGVGSNKAGSLLAEFRRMDPPWIIKTGPDHHPDTKYKLVISANGEQNGQEYHPPVPSPDLFSESSAHRDDDGSDDLPF